VQDRESLLAEDQRSTAVPHSQTTQEGLAYPCLLEKMATNVALIVAIVFTTSSYAKMSQTISKCSLLQQEKEENQMRKYITHVH